MGLSRPRAPWWGRRRHPPPVPSQATCWLRFAGRVQVPAAPSHPRATEVAVFVEHMRRERGWSEATIRYRRSRADEFLRRFCRGNRTLADITVEAVDCALNDEETRDGRIRTRATIRNHANALRAFFRFAEDRGWCRPGLAATITSPRVYKDATLPAGPSAEDPGGEAAAGPRVSPGFTSRPSLSVRTAAGRSPAGRGVAGVHAPAFVERAGRAGYRPVAWVVSPGFTPRPSLSAEVAVHAKPARAWCRRGSRPGLR